MKIIEPSATIIEDELQKLTLEQRIEKCGRICYKSEDKITDTSAQVFVPKVIKQKHNSVLEMAKIHILIFSNGYSNLMGDIETEKSRFIDYSFVEGKNKSQLLITGSPRAFREAVEISDGHAYLADFLKQEYPMFFDFELEYNDEFMQISDNSICIVNDQFIKDNYEKSIQEDHLWVCVDFVLNRAITQQILRHRQISPLSESQRYCNYFLGKFDSSVKFIKPMNYEEGSYEYQLWKMACTESESTYFNLLKISAPQEARSVLNNSVACNFIVYANITEWKYIFKLRGKGGADPEVKKVVIPLEEEFIEGGLV